MTRNEIQAKVNDLTTQLANTPRNAGQKRKDLEFTLTYWVGQLERASPEPVEVKAKSKPRSKKVN